MNETNWKTTSERFVAFFDIMGFKEIVERNTHLAVVKQLDTLKATLGALESINTNDKFFDTFKISKAETKSITFSDSIVIFSKGDSIEDACKILVDTSSLILQSLENSIAIKGAISYGKITVDLDRSLFFGRPIIDAYLLHDQLHLYSVVLDHYSESKLADLELPTSFRLLIHDYKTHMKSGKINHKLINAHSKELLKAQIEHTKNMYKTVSGSPRIYVDNTIEFLNSLVEK